MRTLLKQRALALWMIAVFVQSVAIAAEIGVDIRDSRLIHYHRPRRDSERETTWCLLDY